MKVKLVAAFVLCLVCFLDASAQYRQSKRRPSASNGGLSDRIYFGGGGGFSGGTQFLNVSVSPLVGYKFTEKFSGGVQLVYQYVKFGDVSANNYGGGPFVRYNFAQKLFGYTQYEYLNYGMTTGAMSNSNERLDFTSWFVGLGYTEPISDRVAFNITALYNLLYRDGSNSPYRSPLQFRVGIVAGLF
ncbi:hypothetical protein [Marinoscillum furvescens]|uniref:Outer membrane protein with beta-barrel domain n=1 Tax=Marinoscillum furvescens DSM 4134 TaxID=1122208 RepID=A0A3D9L568_MARFU|nr:hypothetical protein [Marinoscillum furvescens]RED99465.1 hypothetical protein C7460_10881 [Marinoscillum furvescens DSM 4134]